MGKEVKNRAAYQYDLSRRIKVYTYIPAHISKSSEVLFVMHGMLRNAEDYLDAWIDYGIKSNTIIIAPEFKREIKDQSHDYNEGNIKDPNKGLNKKELWSFKVIENIFNQIKEEQQLNAETYSIFGHSAGAQFVHRMVLFFPESNIKNAYAANAGWYTLTDFNVSFPYGLKNSPANLRTVEKALDMNLTIVLGTADIELNDPNLRKTEQAMRQGKNRLERGINFYKTSRDFALSQKWSFNWNLLKVENVGHDQDEIAKFLSTQLLSKGIN